MDTVYERALSEVGQNGKFQRKFDIVYNLVLVSFWGMSYMNIIMVLVLTPYHCQLPPKPENVSQYNWKLQHIPIESSGSLGSYSKFSSCLVYDDGNNNTKNCNAYEYDTSWYKSTVPMEYDWVCNKEILVANAFAYSRIGEVIGSLVFGWFGDMFGRRITYKASLGLMIVGRTISVCSGNSFILFTFGCMVSSFPSWSVVQSVAVISLEISSPKRRTLAATFRCAAWTFGVSLMPFLYWWLQNWRLFMIVTTSPLAVFLLLSWNIIESPRWLLLEGKNENCVRVLRRIAETNDTEIKPSTERELKANLGKTKTQSYGPLALFSSWTLGYTTVLQLMCWVCVTICYTVLVMSAGEKTDGNPFLEFAWQTAAEMPGNFLGAWFSDRYGRRHCGSTSFGVMATIFILLSLRTSVLAQFPWMQAWWVGSILLMVCRLFVNVAYYVISMFNMELYPTCLRQSGMSLGNVFSSAAAAIAPYILYLGHRNNATLPNIILTGSSVLGVLTVLLLPETLNVSLPETLEDAQNFRKLKQKVVQLKPNTLLQEKSDCVVYVAKDYEKNI